MIFCTFYKIIYTGKDPQIIPLLLTPGPQSCMQHGGRSWFLHNSTVKWTKKMYVWHYSQNDGVEIQTSLSHEYSLSLSCYVIYICFRSFVFLFRDKFWKWRNQ